MFQRLLAFVIALLTGASVPLIHYNSNSNYNNYTTTTMPPKDVLTALLGVQKAIHGDCTMETNKHVEMVALFLARGLSFTPRVTSERITVVLAPSGSVTIH